MLTICRRSYPAALAAGACLMFMGSALAGPGVLELDITEVHLAMQKQKLRCESLVQAYLKRIRAYDKTSGLNAIVRVNPTALRRAKELDAAYVKSGTLQPLHCVPVILKDNFDTHDLPTEAGSKALKDYLPPDDAFMVQRLRQAGAIILARSNMGEWAFSPHHTISSTLGETRNPYDLQRVPAGSSGGTAAAVAANFGLVGMGTDTGNSIRGPASHTALVGMRSTIGATSRDGIVPLLANRDIAGPMTRTVRDNAVIFQHIAGYDPADVSTKVMQNKGRIDYVSGLSKRGLKGKRIAVIEQIYDASSAHPDIVRLMQQAVADLKAAGAVVVDDFFIADFVRLRDATGFCSRFRFDLENYLAKGDAPFHKLEQIVAAGNYLPHNKGAMDWAMNAKHPAKQNPPCVDVANDPRRKAYLDAVLEAMDDAGVDLLVYPSWSYPPRKLDDMKSPHGNNSPVIAPHTGQPAITVPMGFTANGLPAGLQFLGRPFSEPLLYQAAYAYEQRTHHRRAPAGFGALADNPLTH